MKGSVGQALRDARLEKNLTVEEVSRSTKIRPERIGDLERDDYTRFPNIAYARNFLVLYAKFLGVDISKYPTVEVGSTVGLGDYQYLRSDETEAPVRTRQEPAGPPEKPRWLIAFFIFLAMLALGALLGWTYMTIRRLGPVETIVPKEVVSKTPTPAPTSTPSPTPKPSPSPETVVPAQPVVPMAAAPSPEPEVRRAEPLPSETPEPVAPAIPVATATPAPSPETVIPTEGEEREVTIRVTRKIKLRVVKDNPKAPSLYLGFANSLQPPLVYKGKHFWIKTADPDALNVTVDGQPVTGPESGVEILRTPGL